MNVGIIGLIAAIGKFDEKRNVQFDTYARYRIRGAVLDELRARDWIPGRPGIKTRSWWKPIRC